ncbi:MAG: dihydrofolate reductase, partial [Corynebacterium sp.]|nr:dihydrofolate reductase [Corynebacterium sp.]
MSDTTLTRDALRAAGLPDDVEVAMIWAQTTDNIIGDGTDMPWYLPEDLEHFKNSTVG